MPVYINAIHSHLCLLRVLLERNFCHCFRDGDGVLDEFDNCPDLPNGEQADADGDNKGSQQ